MRQQPIIYTDGEYEVVLDRNTLVLCNRKGCWEHHAHFAKKKKDGRYDLHSIQMVIDFERKKKLAALKRACGATPHLLSAATGEGGEAVLRALMAVVEEARAEAAPGANDVDDRWKA